MDRIIKEPDNGPQSVPDPARYADQGIFLFAQFLFRLIPVRFMPSV